MIAKAGMSICLSVYAHQQSKSSSGDMTCSVDPHVSDCILAGSCLPRFQGQPQHLKYQNWILKKSCMFVSFCWVCGKCYQLLIVALLRTFGMMWNLPKLYGKMCLNSKSWAPGPRLGVTLGGWKWYSWICGVGFAIGVQCSVVTIGLRCTI